MVLNFDDFDVRKLVCEGAVGVKRMLVNRNDIDFLDLEKIQEVADGLALSFKPGKRFGIADMLAHERIAPQNQRKCRPHHRSDRKDYLFRFDRKSQGHRRIAARTPNRIAPPSKDHVNRIVGTDMDVPVVCEHEVSKFKKFIEFVVEDDRLAAPVGGCHHKRPPDRIHEKEMQRRVRDHESEPLLAGRNESRNRAVWLRFEQNYRCGSRFQHFPFAVR